MRRWKKVRSLRIYQTNGINKFFYDVEFKKSRKWIMIKLPTGLIRYINREIVERIEYKKGD